MESTPQTTGQQSRPSGAPQGGKRWMPIVLVSAAILFVLVALFGERGIMREVQHRRTLQNLNGELEKVANQNRALRDEIDALRNNGKYVEAIARRELGMVKPDEIIYQFPASGEKAAAIKPPGSER